MGKYGTGRVGRRMAPAITFVDALVKGLMTKCKCVKKERSTVVCVILGSLSAAEAMAP